MRARRQALVCVRERPHRARKPRPPPPKLLGEVEVADEWGLDDRHWSASASAPLPDPPPQTAWGRENGRKARRSGIEFSPLPSPRGTRGEGPGVGGPLRRSSMPVVEPPSPAPRPTSPSSSGRGGEYSTRHPAASRSNSPLSARNERGGAGGGAPRRTQCNLVRRAASPRRPLSPAPNAPRRPVPARRRARGRTARTGGAGTRTRAGRRPRGPG